MQCNLLKCERIKSNAKTFYLIPHILANKFDQECAAAIVQRLGLNDSTRVVPSLNHDIDRITNCVVVWKRLVVQL